MTQPHQRTNAAKAVLAYQRGDHVTDVELQDAIVVLGETLEVLGGLGLKYEFPRRELADVRSGFMLHREARKSMKIWGKNPLDTTADP